MKQCFWEKINNRLTSETGASLSVALLFFVMCAVVGSVILAAAGTTAGRISRIQESDKGRYALESAADLVENELIAGGGVICHKSYQYDDISKKSAEEKDGYKQSTKNVSPADSDFAYVNSQSPDALAKIKFSMAEAVIKANWQSIVALDKSELPDDVYWNNTPVWHKEITYRLNWNERSIKSFGSSTNTFSVAGSTEYASQDSVTKSDSDNTNIVTIVPNPEAARRAGDTGEFDISLQGTKELDVHAVMSMDQYGKITVALTLPENENKNANDTSKMTLVIDAEPATVQFDLIRNEEPPRPTPTPDQNNSAASASSDATSNELQQEDEETKNNPNDSAESANTAGNNS